MASLCWQYSFIHLRDKQQLELWKKSVIFYFQIQNNIMNKQNQTLFSCQDVLNDNRHYYFVLIL